MTNVLIFPSNTEIAREIYESLKHNKNYNLLGASSVIEDCKGSYLFKENLYLPTVNDSNWIDRLNECIELKNIHFIFPAHDDVSLYLSKATKLIKANIIGHSAFINETCRFKSNTYEYLKDRINVPTVYNLSDNTDIPYPIFAKPNNGSGSKFAEKINNESELGSYIAKHSIGKSIFCEYLPGQEYTVDCFSHGGNLIFSGARIRSTTKAGISEISKNYHHPTIYDIAEKLNSIFRFNSAWFFQLKLNSKSEFTLLEIGPRISGGMSLYRTAGINFAELSILSAANRNINNIIDYTKYVNIEFCKFFVPKFKVNYNYSNLYIDFDDTLYCHKTSTINKDIIALCINAKNTNKKCYLITRHIGQSYISILNKYGIYDIFDSVIHITDNITPKAKFISSDSILIDDSYTERSSATNPNARIYCFDSDSTQYLM